MHAELLHSYPAPPHLQGRVPGTAKPVVAWPSRPSGEAGTSPRKQHLSTGPSACAQQLFALCICNLHASKEALQLALDPTDRLPHLEPPLLLARATEVTEIAFTASAALALGSPPTWLTLARGVARGADAW